MAHFKACVTFMIGEQLYSKMEPLTHFKGREKSSWFVHMELQSEQHVIHWLMEDWGKDDMEEIKENDCPWEEAHNS